MPTSEPLDYQTRERPSVVSTTLVWAAIMALIIGAIGFAIGFGPLIFNPQSNQGPLLGIFSQARSDSLPAAC